VLVAHQDLLPAVLGVHRDFLIGIVDRDRLLEDVLEGGGEPDEKGTDHGAIIADATPKYHGLLYLRLPMKQEAAFLTAEQFLLTTLMVQLALVAVLATMLVRFPWF